EGVAPARRENDGIDARAGAAAFVDGILAAATGIVDVVGVVAVTTRHVVRTGAADQDIVAGVAVQRVLAVDTANDVIPGGSVQRIGAVVAEDEIVVGPADLDPLDVLQHVGAFGEQAQIAA